VDTCTPPDIAATKEEIVGLKDIHKTSYVGFDDLLMVNFERETWFHTCGKKVVDGNKVLMDAPFVNTNHQMMPIARKRFTGGHLRH
jgi:hypothetical protein